MRILSTRTAWRRRTALPLLTVGALLLAGCSAEPPPPVIAGDIRIDPWPLPTTSGAAQPDLSVAPDGRVLLSWLDNDPGRRPAFQFAAWYPDGHWEGPRTIAVGNRMFVNWADTPHIAATADHALWVHWLQKSADKPYAYDIMLARSRDHGMNWSAPRRVHDDGTTTEHGFVAFWPQAEDSLGMVWLDGRETGGGEAHGDAGEAAGAGGHDGHDKAHADGHDAGGEGGAMTLRSAVFDGDLRAGAESMIDARTCDCCQTDAAKTTDGAVVVYRDRSEDEIRDIRVTRFDGKTWSTPQPVHADGWKMPGCPVNGPSVAAIGKDVVVGWYTGADDRIALKLARAVDGGARFAAPVVLDQGEAVQGRIAVAMDARQIWAVWIREEGGRQSLWLSRRSRDLTRELQRIKLADIAGTGRATGFPRIVINGDTAFVVWTQIIDGEPQLAGATITAAAKRG